MNGLKTTLLLTGLTLILMVAGEVFGGSDGMLIAFAVAAALNFFSYFYSDKLALSMYRAQQVDRNQMPRLHALVEGLVPRAGIPMPKLYVIPTMSPNAFATGRNPKHASVAVTEGILNLLSDEELEGVLAHELGHVKNRDILTSSIAATLAGAITMLARIGIFFGGGERRREGGGAGQILMLILAPIAAFMIQMWVSRTREYAADASAAALTMKPWALASALEKISGYGRRVPLDASPATAHMFIIAPFTGASLMNLFSTHPPVEKRIERLMGRQ